MHKNFRESLQCCHRGLQCESGTTHGHRIIYGAIWYWEQKSQAADPEHFFRTRRAILDEFILQDEAPEKVDLAERRKRD